MAMNTSFNIIGVGWYLVKWGLLFNVWLSLLATAVVIFYILIYMPFADVFNREDGYFNRFGKLFYLTLSNRLVRSGSKLTVKMLHLL